MGKRHVMRAGDWETIFGRLEELVLANSGEDPFEEIFKLLVVKLWSEMQPDDSRPFSVRSSTTETAANFNHLLAVAAKRWAGIISGPAITHLTSEHLTVCIEALEPHSLLDTNVEALDGLFEYLISKAAKGAKGQYFTPRHVIDCCVQIADPGPEETVIDPACGSAGFLIHTLNYLRAQHPSMNVDEYCQKRLWGCDFDHRAIRVAKALMLIAGDGHDNLYRLNSLLTPNANVSLFSMTATDDATPRMTIEDVTRARLRNFPGFDVILTNPPFAGEVKEQHLLDAYNVYRKGRRVERDVLFLERCVGLLRPGGRLAIVLPHNKFGAPAWTYVREWLVRHMRVVAVLGLGRHTFLPHTHQKASVLFGVKRERAVLHPAREEILFLISEHDGKDSAGRIIPRTNVSADDPIWLQADHDLDEAVTVFRDFIQSSQTPWRTA